MPFKWFASINTFVCSSVHRMRDRKKMTSRTVGHCKRWRHQWPSDLLSVLGSTSSRHLPSRCICRRPYRCGLPHLQSPSRQVASTILLLAFLAMFANQSGCTRQTLRYNYPRDEVNFSFSQGKALFGKGDHTRAHYKRKFFCLAGKEPNEQQHFLAFIKSKPSVMGNLLAFISSAFEQLAGAFCLIFHYSRRQFVFFSIGHREYTVNRKMTIRMKLIFLPIPCCHSRYECLGNWPIICWLGNGHN